MKKMTAQERWMKKVEKTYPAAKGSLREVRKSCSRPGCKACSSGKRHPAWLLTYYLDGRQNSKHVPKELVGELRKALLNGRKLEDEMVLSGIELLDSHRRR